MEKSLELKAEIREGAGSSSAEEVRGQGRIPAIIYGHKQEPVSISLDAHDFVEGLHHGHRLMDISIGKKREKTIVKELQYDHLGKKVIHADLMRVSMTEKVKVSVPIELKGTAKGMSEGGIIVEHADQIEIECKVTDIPETIRVSVKDMEIGENFHAGDIELPEGLTLLSAADLLIVGCEVVAAAKTTEEVEEEEPAAPEIISKGKEEEEAEEAPQE